MVDTLQPYSKALADVKTDLPKILRNIIINNKKRILNILKETQLSKGLGSDGELLGTYSKYTEIISIFEEPKPRKTKREGSPYNFEWTGKYFDAFDIDFEDEESFSLFSKDAKAKLLNDKFGEIETLTDQNNKIVNQEILLPEMYEEIIRRLFI